jgi:hypothetical protein
MVISVDARQLRSLVSGPVDLCLTSPPYMTPIGHPQNRLTGYTSADGDYDWTTPASLEGETSGKDVTRGIWEEAPAGAAGTSGADGV